MSWPGTSEELARRPWTPSMRRAAPKNLAVALPTVLLRAKSNVSDGGLPHSARPSLAQCVLSESPLTPRSGVSDDKP